MATPTMELPDFEAEEIGRFKMESKGAIPMMDSRVDFLPASEFSLDLLPELPKGTDVGTVSGSVYHTRGYHVGKLVRVCNHLNGSKVDAVVIDSIGDRVKLFYQIGQRCFTQVACSCVMNMGMPASRDLQQGATVMVKSATVNAWFKGTVMWSDGGFVKIHWRHNGRQCAKVIARNSPDLRVFAGSTALKEEEDEDEEEVEDEGDEDDRESSSAASSASS